MEVYTSSVSERIDSNKVNSFRYFIKTARKSGAKVYVIYSPLFQKLANYNEIEMCSELCAKEQIPFLDFSRDTFFMKRGGLFYDPVHLNYDGATILSKLIAHKIKTQ